MENEKYCLGIDVGSTTSKLVLLSNGEIIHSSYERHNADPRRKICQMLAKLRELIGKRKVSVALSGSGGMGIANDLDVAFVRRNSG